MTGNQAKLVNANANTTESRVMLDLSALEDSDMMIAA
jgi:hypothetical protein